MNRYLAEFIGTFALVFAGTGAIVINEYTRKHHEEALKKHPVVIELKESQAKFVLPATGDITHVGIALTFGLVVMVMVYAFGDISGAHLNPAVTLGLAARGRFEFAQTIPYIASQCAGALLASLTLFVLFPDPESKSHKELEITIDAKLGMERVINVWNTCSKIACFIRMPGL